MLEHDSTLIRRPVLVGHQHIEGVWFSHERFDEQERAKLILDQWQTGSSAYRFADGDLLRFGQPLSVMCETQVGWPLIRQGDALCSALLTPQEARSLPAADVWLVRASHVSALQLRDATLINPAQWIDVSGYTLLETYDCRRALPEPIVEPPAVASDVREILGGALRPVSPERDEVMKALLERKGSAPEKIPDQAAGRPADNPWKSPEVASLPWLKLGISGILVAAFIWMAVNDKKGQTMSPPAADSPDVGAVILGILISATLFTLLLLWIRRFFAGQPSGGYGVPQSQSQPGIAPRATPTKPRVNRWRRWLTRLTLRSPLSALYGKRQAEYMRRMMEMFEDGDLEEALRHAIPLEGGQSTGEQAFGTPQRRQELVVGERSGPANAMLFEDDLKDRLKHLYRKSFERLDREGRVEEAVFVLAELLKERQEALDYLEKHERYQQAADLALTWDMPPAVIVRLLCLAGNWQRAVQVARRDDAFADAVMMLEQKQPESAGRLRLEWAESLIGKGLWLQAVDAIWSLPGERARAAQWLLDAEAAGGRLAIRALVKRAILLPDTLAAYGEWVEQLRDDPQRFAERAALAEALLQHQSHAKALAWLTGATIHAIIADEANGQGRLTHNQLQALVIMSKDKLLQADLPGKALPRRGKQPLDSVEATLEWSAPAMGSRVILDAVALEDSRYLLALGEAGAVVVDASGKRLFHFSVPAQAIVMAHSRQVALVLVRRSEAWRISKLDLVNRTATDLGVHKFDVFARIFNGSSWTIGQNRQLRVVDVDRGLETLWHVSDLPGRILGLKDDAHGEYLWLYDPESGSELWHYRLPDRRLMSREPASKTVFDDGRQLFSASSDVVEIRIKREREDDPVLVIEQRGSRKGYRLPGCIEGPEDDPVEVLLLEHWLLTGYLVSDDETRWQFIHRNSDRLCATLQWPRPEVRTRLSGADWLMFDDQGRLSHINAEEGTQRNLTIN